MAANGRRREIVTREVDLLRAGDGTTVLIRLENENGQVVRPGYSGTIVFRVWCGGDDAHCDERGWCSHTRELVEAQGETEGRRIELVDRP